MFSNGSQTLMGLGRVGDSYHDNPWTVHTLSPLNITIQYNNGDLSPNIIFTYVENNFFCI